MSLWETTSSSVTGLYFSTLYVLSVGRDFHYRTNLYTKEVCHPVLSCPHIHHEGPPCLCPCLTTTKMGYQSRFACPRRCPCPSVIVKDIVKAQKDASIR